MSHCYFLCVHLSWAFGLFLPLTIKNNAAIKLYTSHCMNICFSLGYRPRSRISGSCTNFVFNTLKSFGTLSKLLHHFTFLPTMYKCPNFSASSPTLTICLFVSYCKVRWKWFLNMKKGKIKGPTVLPVKILICMTKLEKNSNCVEKHK